MLVENFKKQAEGAFTKEDIARFWPKIMAILKPEATEDVKAAMSHFAGSFGR